MRAYDQYFLYVLVICQPGFRYFFLFCSVNSTLTRLVAPQNRSDNQPKHVKIGKSDFTVKITFAHY